MEGDQVRSGLELLVRTSGLILRETLRRPGLCKMQQGAREVRRETVSNGSRSPVGKSYRQNCVQGMRGNWIVLIFAVGKGRRRGQIKGRVI